MADESRLTWALVLSVLLHGLLLSLLPWLRHLQLTLPKPPALVDVDVMPLPARPKAPPPVAAVPKPAPQQAAPPLPVPKQQVVSPPDKGEEKEPPNARFLSDTNNTVQKQTVHRGQPAGGSPEVAHQSAAPAKPSTHAAEAARPARPERAHPAPAAGLPKLDQLLPDTGELIREGIVRPQAAPAPTPQLEASNERTDLLRHGDPWKSRSVRGGTLDFLPDIQDGDVTMLNTKADQFAPFVRRVAVRVFQNFVILLRRSYDTGAGAAEESAVVEAVMDKRGNLLRITTKDRSLSAALATDRNLQSACREGFFDRNPPSGAETNDGNIHFLFEARVATAVDAAGRRVPTWALLGAGLL